MFRLPNEPLNPLLLWNSALKLYKYSLVKTWYWFILFLTAFHVFFNYKNILSALNLNDESAFYYIIVNHFFDDIGFIDIFIIYFIIIYFIFFGLMYIYSITESGKSLRGKIHSRLTDVYIKLFFATVLFYYVYVAIPAAFAGFVTFNDLGFFLKKNLFDIIHSNYLASLCVISVGGTLVACFNFFIFYAYQILFTGNNVDITLSFINSYYLVKDNFFRNLLIFLLPVLVSIGFYEIITLLIHYTDIQFNDNLLIRTSVPILIKIIGETCLLPFLMSIYLIQANDLEIRQML